MTMGCLRRRERKGIIGHAEYFFSSNTLMVVLLLHQIRMMQVSISTVYRKKIVVIKFGCFLLWGEVCACTRSMLYAVSRGVSYKRHLYRKHKHFVGKESGEGASDEFDPGKDTPEPMSVTAADSTFSAISISARESAHKLKQNRAALFILNTSDSCQQWKACYQVLLHYLSMQSSKFKKVC